MIGRLRGIILEKQPPFVLVDINGIGYEVQMPLTCFYTLPEHGQEVILFTHVVVRDDTQLLFGFINQQEKLLFREIVKVNGMGPKLALTILTGLSAQQFIRVVQYQEINTLVKLSGIGKKTAERLIMEMKDRLKDLSKDLCLPYHPDETVNTPQGQQLTNPQHEAVAALITLGYKPHEANRMVNKIDEHKNNNIDCQVLIRDALRAVGARAIKKNRGNHNGS